MTEVVTSASVTVRVEIPGTGRVYEMRPPTFGEMGAMAARVEGMMVPSDAIFAEAVRDAILASKLPDADKERYSASIDAYFEAEDALRSAVSTMPDPDKRTDEQRRELADLNAAYRRADRARQQAEWAMRDVDQVQDLKRRNGDASRRQRAEIVALCLGTSVDEALALPAGDFNMLHDRAAALLKPGESAEKN